jgi:hypothetical protein
MAYFSTHGPASEMAELVTTQAKPMRKERRYRLM